MISLIWCSFQQTKQYCHLIARQNQSLKDWKQRSVFFQFSYEKFLELQCCFDFSVRSWFLCIKSRVSNAFIHSHYIWTCWASWTSKHNRIRAFFWRWTGSVKIINWKHSTHHGRLFETASLIFQLKEEKTSCVHTLSGCFGRYLYLECVKSYNMNGDSSHCYSALASNRLLWNVKGTSEEQSRESAQKEEMKISIERIWFPAIKTIKSILFSLFEDDSWFPWLQKRYNAPQISRNSCFCCLHSQNQYNMWKTERKMTETNCEKIEVALSSSIVTAS